ncbi:MAG TPA: glucose-6-phosphate isomerase [Flavobacteriaceae bacterium]|nr:glucose-6-phosphate isomerase [Flavobacteriaceae bacterium]
MKLPKINPAKTKAWIELQHHFAEIKSQKMCAFFEENPLRAKQFSIAWNDFFIDFSKNRITDQTKKLLLKLSDEVNLKQAIEAQFSGQKINETEKRAVSHTALRNFDSMPTEVRQTLDQMKRFSNDVITGKYTGYSEKTITDIVNIGIGGSDLGPDMAVEALRFYSNHLKIHFVSNVDGDHVNEILKKLNPETTIFIIVSKSFTTLETITNAKTIRKWFVTKANEAAVGKHFIAVSSNLKAVEAFGITEKNIFPMWDWVGGRFSLWSAVGLSICCAIGYTHFEDMLRGAHQMDKHFKNSPFKTNIPVVLGLLSVWYNNFFKTESEAVVPYTQYLTKLVPYLQQAVMESNGKAVDRNGSPVSYQTGNIIWGGTGTNAQHAFFQLLHQGTKLIPVDFIVFANANHKNDLHQEVLLASCFAQSEALLNGTQQEDSNDPYRVFEGNRPSNTILIKQLTPKNFGSLIAMYEHKLYVQGVVWNIFSYDQWGVELGKKLTVNILENKHDDQHLQASTKNLYNHLSQMKN